jgi:hypothetical protein
LRVLVRLDLEGRILLHQLPQALAQLLLVGLGLGLHGQGDDGGGEADGLQHHGLCGVADGVAGGHVLEAHRGRDVASVDLLDLLALVGVHLEEAADAFLLALGAVQHAVARLHGPGVDPDEGQLAHERVGHDLEDESAEGRVVAGLPRHQLARLGVVGHGGGDVQGRRQVVDDRVQHGLDALVLEGRPADDREQLHGDGGLADARLQLGHGGGLAAHVLLHQVVVTRFRSGLGHLVDHLVAVVLRIVQQVGGDIDDLELGPQLLVQVADGLHLHEVDDPLVLLFLAERELDGDCLLGVEAVVHGLDGMEEVGPHPVHLVHEGDARDLVLVGLPPHGLRLGLHAGHRVEDRHRSVQHAERALHLGREVHVARGVDDVDAVVLPEAGGGRRGDGDPALLLLLHPVHDGGPLVDLAQLVAHPRVIEDALGGRGLPGVDVGRDPDVPGPFEGGLSGH